MIIFDLFLMYSPNGLNSNLVNPIPVGQDHQIALKDNQFFGESNFDSKLTNEFIFQICLMCPCSSNSTLSPAKAEYSLGYSLISELQHYKLICLIRL